MVGEFQYGGKNGLCFVALLQGSPVSAVFHYGNLMFGVQCNSVIPLTYIGGLMVSNSN